MVRRSSPSSQPWGPIITRSWGCLPDRLAKARSSVGRFFLGSSVPTARTNGRVILRRSRNGIEGLARTGRIAGEGAE